MSYVTSWAHVCLSVRCGVSRGTNIAPSKPRSTLSALPPLGCDPLHHTSGPPCLLHAPSSSAPSASSLPVQPFVLQPVREEDPFGDTVTQVYSSPSACLSGLIILKYSSSAALGFADVQMICSVFFSNTSPPTQQLLPQFT